jgi:protein-disulfide isomerase
MNETPLPTPQKKARHALRKELPTFSRAQIVTLLIPAAFVLGLFSGYLVWGRATAVLAAKNNAANQAADQSNAAQAANAQDPQKVTRYTVDEGGNPAIGPQGAPVTIIEFSDYQCPYCRQWYSEVYQRLLQNYPDKIRFVYRDFPLSSIHPDAAAAAEAANCAGEQGRYYDYHDELFGGELGLGAQAYVQYAKELGMDLAKFNDCMSTHRFKGEVDADTQYAENLGVRSTPTFFINGVAIIGAQPYEAFQQVIDQELSGAQQ